MAISSYNKGLLRLVRNEYMIAQETIFAVAENRMVILWKKKTFFDKYLESSGQLRGRTGNVRNVSA